MTMSMALRVLLGLILAGVGYVLVRRIRARMARSMKIYEDGRLRQEYRTIAHFILLIEDPDY